MSGVHVSQIDHLLCDPHLLAAFIFIRNGRFCSADCCIQSSLEQCDGAAYLTVQCTPPPPYTQTRMYTKAHLPNTHEVAHPARLHTHDTYLSCAPKLKQPPACTLLAAPCRCVLACSCRRCSTPSSTPSRTAEASSLMLACEYAEVCQRPGPACLVSGHPWQLVTATSFSKTTMCMNRSELIYQQESLGIAAVVHDDICICDKFLCALVPTPKSSGGLSPGSFT